MNRFLAAITVLASSVLASSAAAQCDAFTFTSTFHPTGGDPNRVALGDLNSDGLLDLALSDATSETVAILFGTPGGGFTAPVAWPAGRSPRSVAIGDLDGDGDRDLAVCNAGFNDALGWHEYGLRVLWNDGTGAFASSTFAPLPAGEIQPTDVALGDLDNDGDLDAAMPLHGTGYLHSKVASFLNNGAGGFAAPALASCGYDPISIVLGQIDGDGALDAVTANYLGNSISTLHSHGDGTFAVGYSQSMTYPQSVALGDFDGDGALDIAIAYRYGINLARNVGGVFSWVATMPSGLLPVAVAFADFDGDGDVDLAAVDEFGDALFIWRNSGAGAFVLAQQLAIGDAPITLEARDLDADGDPDLAVLLGLDRGVALVDNGCPLSTYCVAKTNSLGCRPAIGWTGTPSLGGADDFHVVATQELSHHLGIAFFGLAPAAVPFGGGTRCVHPPLARTPGQDSGGSSGPIDCSGAYDFHVAHAWLLLHGWGAGTELFAQFWSRDPAHPDNSGVALSNGARFIVQP